MRRITFDLDVLRTFVAGVELGSFARAAERLSRSTSAVSAQLKKLEEQAGVPVLRKSGRGMVLTEAGETMLAYARRLLELNDEAAAALHGAELEGWVRLGLQEDFGESLLTDVLGRFARAHPRVKVEVRIARNVELLDRIASGRLDLALAWEAGGATAHAERVGTVPLRWIGGAGATPAWPRDDGEPLPLVMLEAPCIMRAAATAALDRANIPWRIAFTSASLAGTWAAVAAGLGVSLRTPHGLPASVRALLPHETTLPALGELGLCLHRADAEPSPAVERLATILTQQWRGLPSAA
ncbi:LysR substrate-binding domain-containing protein [Dyella japonica]|uniref:LysR family transcriptional regulator n=1 Tax=Dyella japonica A8 TaxID=1217721 RepID=A0A075JX22_9GAMM|nr:LysR substrate-binding domain-containing protein [Dyella japonica]AIF46651.1 LysR family transcriptional regulator [Dyella japonica A8]